MLAKDPSVSRTGVPANCSLGPSVLRMSHRQQPQQRLRLLVHQPSPSCSPSSTTSSTNHRQGLSGITTPATSPTKAATTSIQQQQQSIRVQPGDPNPQWWRLVVVAALGIVICYADRSNMSTAILPMAETFHWDKAFSGVVLSAFFAGYAATQVLGGSLADKYGGKAVLTTGVALWSLFTLVTPNAAAAGVAPLLAARVLLGVGEGVAFPAIHSMIACNVPVSKRSTAVGVITAASYAGTALAFGLSPTLITELGWQWVFYLFGGSALLWLPLWLPLAVLGQPLRSTGSQQSNEVAGPQAASSAVYSQRPTSTQVGPGRSVAAGPSTRSKRQSDGGADQEDTPLMAQLDSTTGGVQEQPASGSSSSSDHSVGFWALLRCREVWAICLCQYTQSYGMYGLLTWLPSFFSSYYHVEVQDLGGYTLLPYFVQGLVGLAAGALADHLLSKQGWSVRSVRVTLQLTGMLGPAACLMAAVSPAVAGHAATASALITLGLGLSALTLGAVSVNHLDIAPRHAGMVFGAGKTAATLAGLVSVPLTGWILQRTDSWPLVFGMIAGHFILGSVMWAAWVGDKPLAEDGVYLPAAAEST